MRRLIVSSIACVSLTAGSASASTLLLDFGDATAYDGIDDPAHFEGTVDASFTAWQAVSNTNIQTVTDSLGNTITVNMGRNTSGTGEGVDLDRNVVAAQSDGGTALTDNPFISFGRHDVNRRDPLGAVISGLPTGEYYVYVIAHQSHDTDTPFTVVGGTTTLSGNPGSEGTNDILDIYEMGESDILEGGIGLSEWQLGVNYARFTIALTAESPNLFIATDGGQGSAGFAYLAGVMVTPVPEPSSMMLVAAAAGMMITRRRR